MCAQDHPPKEKNTTALIKQTLAAEVEEQADQEDSEITHHLEVHIKLPTTTENLIIFS